MELAEYLEQALRLDPAFGEAAKVLERASGPAVLRMAESLAAPLLASLPAAAGRLVAAVAPGVEAAERLAGELESLLGDGRVLYYPPRELPLPGHEVVDLEGSATRARTLFLLDQWRKKGRGDAPILVLPATALAHPPCSSGDAAQPAGAPAPFYLKKGARADLEELENWLAAAGYRRQYLVEAPGEFSVRGGIADIYDPTHPYPFRLELDADTVDRLRYFNPADQRSQGDLPEALAFPLEWEGESTIGSGGLFAPEDGLVLLEPRLARERLEALEDGERAREAYEGWLKERRCLILDPWSAEAGLELESREAGTYRGDVERLTADIGKWRAAKWRVVLAFETEGRRERTAEILAEAGLAARGSLAARTGLAAVAGSRLHHGFLLPAARLAVLTEEDLFGAEQRRRREAEATSGGRPPVSLVDLEEGDYVVHLHHGVGVFSGLAVRETGGAKREYAVLRYAEGDVLYLPTDRIGLIHRYVGAENPSLHRLSSAQWRKTRKRARAAARDVAADLLRLYAERQAAGGFAFSPDVPWQQELESSFPYRETPDQLKAIEDVKADMERPVPMDRMVYGDVGYGKTEVALRAAFKAVMDSRQVAVLVPTTVLALQHGETFRRRFLPWPVRVETLTRFQTPRERRAILEGLASGAVDVVVGTHGILQKKVVFSDLGLLVVDEEHRFGVMHKERLKEMRREVDVLTLTATPIPRTLQMSLSGLRDMSTIDTPIEDRYAVVTTVGVYDEQLVRESIERELEREGQVYYVYNLVEGIEARAESVRRLAPHARVGIGHGQMGEHELEKVMRDFAEGHLDVLVCTTIVESGLDIPNANTLIVDGAERLGLAQLYHLRGRIGRSHRQAYGFFFFREGRRITDAAFQRLRVIRDFSELGSGLRVALKDLEIRGAGNILGAEQHGQVEAVGFELYCRMLQEAVEALKGERRPHMPLITVDLPLPAHLPHGYIESSARRVEVYRRMVDARSEGELDDLEAEVRDRYGPLPVPAVNLFDVAHLRLACLEPGVREMVWSRGRVTLRFRRGSAEFYNGLLSTGPLEALGPEAGTPRHNTSTREVELPLEDGYWSREDALRRLRDLLEASGQ